MRLTTLKVVPGHSAHDLIRALDSGLARMGLRRTTTVDITGQSLMIAMDSLSDDSDNALNCNRIVLARVKAHEKLTLKGLYLVKTSKIPVKRSAKKKAATKTAHKPTRRK